MSTMHDLAIRLRRLRQRHGLTQEQFAEVAGISYKFYQQIEAGRKKQVWLETVERLAAGFGLQSWQLLAAEEPANTVVSVSRRTRAPARKRKASYPSGAASNASLAAAESQAVYATRPARKKRASKKRASRK